MESDETKPAQAAKPPGVFIPPEVIELRLPMFDAVILSEAIQLAKKSGICRARSPHFAGRFFVPERTVRDALGRLQKAGHIGGKNGAIVLHIAIEKRRYPPKRESSKTAITAEPPAKSAELSKSVSAVYRHVSADTAEILHIEKIKKNVHPASGCDANGTAKKYDPKSDVKHDPLGFDGFMKLWREYKLLGTRAEAAKEWDRLNPDSALKRAMRQNMEWRKEHDENWHFDERHKFAGHACRFLKFRKWEEPQVDTVNAAPRQAQTHNGTGHHDADTPIGSMVEESE